MVIKTKFNFGQRLWHICYSTLKGTRKCKCCGGRGELNDYAYGSRQCVACRGKGTVQEFGPAQWIVADKLYNVGHIQARMLDPEEARPAEGYPEREIRYMMTQTGFRGGGTLFSEEDLFESREAAERECRKRNRKVPS